MTKLKNEANSKNRSQNRAFHFPKCNKKNVNCFSDFPEQLNFLFIDDFIFHQPSSIKIHTRILTVQLYDLFIYILSDMFREYGEEIQS